MVTRNGRNTLEPWFLCYNCVRCVLARARVNLGTNTISGDINGDFKVDLDDLVLFAKAYGSKPGDSKWNPNADIDGNGIIGLSDLAVLAQNYGKTA